jgi:hypothetical protein
MLMDDVELYGKMDAPITYNRYMIIVDEPCTLVISAVPCEGQLEMLVSKNNTELADFSGLVVNHMDGGELQGIILDAKGKFYITIRNAGKTDYAEFQIRIHYYS